MSYLDAENWDAPPPSTPTKASPETKSGDPLASFAYGLFLILSPFYLYAMVCSFILGGLGTIYFLISSAVMFGLVNMLFANEETKNPSDSTMKSCIGFIFVVMVTFPCTYYGTSKIFYPQAWNRTVAEHKEALQRDKERSRKNDENLAARATLKKVFKNSKDRQEIDKLFPVR